MWKEGIPTKYAGVMFRSRLEARWASTFDLLGIDWDYEAIDFPGWIPDFKIGARLYDIKPDRSVAGLLSHTGKICRAVRENAVDDDVSVGLVGGTMYADGSIGVCICRIAGAWSRVRGLHVARCSGCLQPSIMTIPNPHFDESRCGSCDAVHDPIPLDQDFRKAWNRAGTIVRWEPGR